MALVDVHPLGLVVVIVVIVMRRWMLTVRRAVAVSRLLLEGDKDLAKRLRLADGDRVARREYCAARDEAKKDQHHWAGGESGQM
jgi:hypothetical protein